MQHHTLAIAQIEDALESAKLHLETATREHAEVMARLNAKRAAVNELTSKSRAADRAGNEAEFSGLALRVRFGEQDVVELTALVAKAAEVVIEANGKVASLENQQRVAIENANSESSREIADKIIGQIVELKGLLSAARAALHVQLRAQGGEVLAQHLKARCMEIERELLAEVATTFDEFLRLDPPASARSRSRLQSCHDFFRPSPSLKDLVASGAKPRA
jgi:hypothetical protein